MPNPKATVSLPEILNGFKRFCTTKTIAILNRGNARLHFHFSPAASALWASAPALWMGGGGLTQTSPKKRGHFRVPHKLIN